MSDFAAEVAALTAATTSLHDAVSERKIQLDNAVTDVSGHTSRTDNPHSVTLGQVGGAPAAHTSHTETHGAPTGGRLLHSGDVTTSHTDITADRLLKVKAFGLGGSLLPASSDANNAIESGFYYTVSDSANIPAQVTSTALLQVHRAFNLVSQIIHQNQVRCYVRFSVDTGATWTSWGHFAALTLGTVSQVSGVPTGAVIERGSNANGEYVKFADGTLICTFAGAPTMQMETAFLGGFRSTSYVVTFPASFANLNYEVSLTPSADTAYDHVSTMELRSHRGVGQTSVAFTAFATQTAVARRFSAIVVGRWF